MQNLSITLIQSNLVWENVAANLEHFEKRFEAILETDLIVLPEMFSTGFTMNSEKLAEEMDGLTIQWMAKQAHKTKAVICGSLILKEGHHIYNRFIWMRPDGTHEHYDKRHLFRMGEENEHFSNGEDKLIVELKGWKLCPLICYDLRFPVWSRNQNEAFDVLIYVANWPEARIMAWEKLLYARAIENQCYVAAVNRFGIDGKGVSYIGNSMFVDPKGGLIWKAKDNTDETVTLELSLEELNAFRKKFPVGKDADQFRIE